MFGCAFARVFYQDIAGDVGDLQCQRQHVELAHHLQDELGVHPRQLQQVEQVRRVAVEQKQQNKQYYFKMHNNLKAFAKGRMRTYP